MAEMNHIRIYQGDCLKCLSKIADESVQCVVTSPPYWGLRDYGVVGQIGLEGSIEEYVEKMVGVFREVRRVLRKDGTLWLNIGDSYAGGGRAGTGGLQVWGGIESGNQNRRYGPPMRLGILKSKDLCGIPWRLALALQGDGWWLRSDIIWSKPNPMPESVTDRPTKAHEYIFLMTKDSKYYYDGDAVREESICSGQKIKMADGWATYEGGHGSFHKNGREKGKNKGSVQANGRNLRSVWTIATAPFPEAHFATFPPVIPERCIKAGTKEGDVVLDPFAGAGTTLMVAAKLGRNSVGIELNPDYVAMSVKRLKKEMGMLAEIEVKEVL